MRTRDLQENADAAGSMPEMEFIFSPVRHFERMKALQKRLKQIQSSSAKAVGFTLFMPVEK